MTPRPHTFTFYSYKGGVGRSMALLNVAYTLHTMGRHVLIVDLDLEAPGVSGFLRRNDELEPHAQDQPDVLDLLTDVLPLARWQFGSPTRPEVPVLANYLRAVKSEKFAPPRNPRFQRTRLDVLCASDERDYTARLAALDIANLTADDLAETGNVLREIFLRHQFQWARELDGDPQPTPYDYILIDSRTGFTETSGLCIGPLADRLVIFCGLNDQNISGTAEFLKVVGLKPGPRTKPWDDDDDISDTAHSARLGEKPSLLVATPVPTGDMEMKEDRFKAMKRILDVRPDLAISYHSRLSLFETVFIRNFPSEIITREYKDLTDSILSLVSDHPRQLQPKALTALRSGAPSGDADPSILLRYAAMLDEDGAAQFAAQLGYVADELSAKAAELSGTEADTIFAAANEKYRAAIAIKPDDHETLTNWGVALSRQAKLSSDETACILFSDACGKFRTALAVKPDSHEPLNNWGNALAALAELKPRDTSDSVFADAGRKFQAAIAIKPNNHQAFTNWGNSLASQAQLKTGDDADALFAAAYEKYRAALAIKPDAHKAFINWGIALGEQASRKPDAYGLVLFVEAIQKFQAAVEIDPNSHEALCNWGNTLAALAQRHAGNDADILFVDAGRKFQAAIKVKPDMHEALHNWGIALAAQAQRKTGNDADTLFADAGSKYQAAIAIKPSHHESLTNWADALAAQANFKSGGEADQLFSAAEQKYLAALALTRSGYRELNNWGNVLFAQAQRKTGTEAESLFASAIQKYRDALALNPESHEILANLGRSLTSYSLGKVDIESARMKAEAAEKFEKSLAIKPDNMRVLIDWGVVLADQAQQTNAPEADDLFSAAAQKYSSALSLQPDNHAALYNMACLESLRKDSASALSWLHRAITAGYALTREKLDTDTDFAPIRDTPEFKSFVASLPA
jgi:tetratricopeptide (TPR) repeat protein